MLACSLALTLRCPVLSRLTPRVVQTAVATVIRHLNTLGVSPFTALCLSDPTTAALPKPYGGRVVCVCVLA